ncbi:MAG TPA: Uma2 family endonuclease [Bryobacteraceae bacterium]|nr:Uma2 family endonuclease [Bryobacteraceae bacterium]
MPTEALLSVEEYLATSYRPDCDYVDGRLEERNVGRRDHSNLQMVVSAYLYARRKEWGIRVYPEQRIQVGPTRFRVPDVTVVLGEPSEQVFTKPPFLCIEILSPEDRLSRVEQRIDDFLKMGVAYVWLLHPETRRVYVATKEQGFHEFKGEVLRTENPALEVPLGEIFE